MAPSVPRDCGILDKGAYGRVFFFLFVGSHQIQRLRSQISTFRKCWDHTLGCKEKEVGSKCGEACSASSCQSAVRTTLEPLPSVSSVSNICPLAGAEMQSRSQPPFPAANDDLPAVGGFLMDDIEQRVVGEECARV